MFETDLFFLCANGFYLLYQHPMSKKLGKNLNKETESEIKEKATKQP